METVGLVTVSIPIPFISLGKEKKDSVAHLKELSSLELVL